MAHFSLETVHPHPSLLSTDFFTDKENNLMRGIKPESIKNITLKETHLTEKKQEDQKKINSLKFYLSASLFINR